MKIFTGFVFTEGPIADLKSRGFSFLKDESGLAKGYRSFRAAFAQNCQIEIREILDENLYLQSEKVSHFEPWINSAGTELPVGTFENTVKSIGSAVTADLIPQGDLRTYFEIRKPFPLWALWLNCEDFQKFCQVARPDRLFEFQGRQVALIHLGPNCFDFLVSS